MAPCVTAAGDKRGGDAKGGTAPSPLFSPRGGGRGEGDGDGGSIGGGGRRWRGRWRGLGRGRGRGRWGGFSEGELKFASSSSRAMVPLERADGKNDVVWSTYYYQSHAVTKKESTYYQTLPYQS